MDNSKATMVNNTMLPLWLFLILVFFGPQSCLACDVDSFVYEEFGLRCQRLSEYIKDLQVAQKLAMPTANEKRRKLLNEWVSFYLDHGNKPPASFTMMTDANWQKTLSKAGETIGDLVYTRIAPEMAESACIPFDLLTQQPKLQAAMTILASWAIKIDEPVGETASQTSQWIAANLGYFIELNLNIGRDYQTEAQSSRALITYFNRQWRLVIDAPTLTAETIYHFTRDDLVERLKKEFERWRRLAFT